MNVLGVLETFSTEADRNLYGLPEAKRPDCRPGCHACCYQWVTCTVLEATTIAEELRRDGSAASTLTALRKYERATSGIRDRDEHWRAHVPCPFLEGDSCSIYAYRPLACRQLYSFDAHACHTQEPGAAVAYWKQPMELGTDLQLSLTRMTPGHLAAKLPVDLARGVRIAIKHPDALKLLSSGKDPFRSARLKAFRILESSHGLSAQEMNSRVTHAGTTA